MQSFRAYARVPLADADRGWRLCTINASWLQLFREDKGAWLVPVMSGLVHNLRDVARMTDAEARRSGKKSDALDNCGTLMQSCFRTALQATGGALLAYEQARHIMP